MRTIADDILTWSWFSEPHGYNFNGFLISDRTGNLAIDPVEPSEQALNELAQRGVSRILLTNRNHVRAANRVRASTRARTAIHPGDAAYARGQGAVATHLAKGHLDELTLELRDRPVEALRPTGRGDGTRRERWRVHGATWKATRMPCSDRRKIGRLGHPPGDGLHSIPGTPAAGIVHRAGLGPRLWSPA